MDKLKQANLLQLLNSYTTSEFDTGIVIEGKIKDVLVKYQIMSISDNYTHIQFSIRNSKVIREGNKFKSVLGLTKQQISFIMMQDLLTLLRKIEGGREAIEIKYEIKNHAINRKTGKNNPHIILNITNKNILDVSKIQTIQKRVLQLFKEEIQKPQEQ